MEYKELLELIKTVSDSNILDFQYEQGDTKIVMCSADHAENQSAPVQVREIKVEQNAVEQQAEAQVEKPVENLVISPLVGTFYVAPAEGAEPFVKVGDEVKTGQTLAIVEAMKLMNEIESEFDGIISEVYVKNGEMVEYGQPLFAIK